ncbi:hypothetical protein BJ944DRAFT_233267 [Cunninghamella echinulata]|nr:hypothetical protein BJ944DRAFT_233267 [Cunninghamella echinulata]
MVYVYSDYPIEEDYYHSVRQPKQSVKRPLKRQQQQHQPIEDIIWVEEEHYRDFLPYEEPPFLDDYLHEYPYEEIVYPPLYSPSWHYKYQPMANDYIEDEEGYYDYYDYENMINQEKDFLRGRNKRQSMYSNTTFPRVVHQDIHSPMTISSQPQPPPPLRRRRSQPILRNNHRLRQPPSPSIHRMCHHDHFNEDGDHSDFYYCPYDNDNIILQEKKNNHTRQRSSSITSFHDSPPSHALHLHHHPHPPPPPPPPSILNDHNNNNTHLYPIDQQSPTMLHQRSEIQNQQHNHNNNSFFGQAPNHTHPLLPIPQQPMIPGVPLSNFFPMPLPPPPPSSINYGFPTLPGMVPPPPQQPHGNLQQQAISFDPMIIQHQLQNNSFHHASSSLPTSPIISTLPLSPQNNNVNKNLAPIPPSSSSISTPSYKQETIHTSEKQKENNNNNRDILKKEQQQQHQQQEEEFNIASPHSVASDSKLKPINNGLVPLGRSLSLGTSQSLMKKKNKIKRRSSLFGNLFNTITEPSASSSTTIKKKEDEDKVERQQEKKKSGQLIPVHELTYNSLTRKQSLKLEKKIKALSKREYIWCYQINQKNSTYFLKNRQYDHLLRAGPCWYAMTSKNQKALDPYIMYYQSQYNMQGQLLPDTLPSLLPLEKEPKLPGSLTAMPAGKLARAYPSMLSATSYIEVIINCLPADGQFAIQQS